MLLYDFQQSLEPNWFTYLCLGIAVLLFIGFLVNRKQRVARTRLLLGTCFVVVLGASSFLILAPSYLCYRNVYRTASYLEASGVVQVVLPAETNTQSSTAFLIGTALFEVEGPKLLTARFHDPDLLNSLAQAQTPVRIRYTWMCEGKNVILRLEK